jgi:hypothetical protein
MIRSPDDACTVFEIVNAPLKEIYVGSTRQGIFLVADELRRAPPEPVKHWDFSQVEPIRSVEFGLGAADARAFIANYVAAELPDGWRFLL